MLWLRCLVRARMWAVPAIVVATGALSMTAAAAGPVCLGHGQSNVGPALAPSLEPHTLSVQLQCKLFSLQPSMRCMRSQVIASRKSPRQSAQCDNCTAGLHRQPAGARAPQAPPGSAAQRPRRRSPPHLCRLWLPGHLPAAGGARPRRADAARARLCGRAELHLAGRHVLAA